MAKENLNVRLKITADGKKARAEISGVADSTRRVGTAAEKAAGQTEGFFDGLLPAGKLALSFNEIAEAGERLSGLAQDVIALGDSYRSLTARIANTAGSQEQAVEIMERLGAIARSTHAPLEDTAELYARLAQATKDAGVSQEELLSFTAAVNDAMRVSGTSATEAAGALTQLSQALASGALRGDEFNSVNEQMPVIMDALAASLGKSRGELREMAEQGELTSERVLRAVLGMAGEWHAAAAGMPATLRQAITDLESAWQEYLGQSESVGAASEAIAAAIGLVADHLAELIDAAAAAALAALPALLAKTAQSMAGLVTNARQAAAAAREQASATAAQVAAARESALADEISAKAKLHVATVSRQAAAADLARARAQEAEARATQKAAAEVAVYGAQRAGVERQATAATNLRVAAEKRLSQATMEMTAATAAYNKAAAATVATQTAATASSGRLKTALRAMADPMNLLNAGMAAFTGWEIGAWARRNFAIVRKAGVFMVEQMAAGFEVLRTGWELFKAVFADGTLEEAWQRHIERSEEMREIFAQMYKDAELTDERLAKLGETTDEAGAGFRSLGAATKAAAAAQDPLAGAMKSLGVDLDELRTGLDRTSRRIITDFDAIVSGAGMMGDTVRESGAIIVAALEQAAAKTEGLRVLSATVAALARAEQEGALAGAELARAKALVADRAGELIAQLREEGRETADTRREVERLRERLDALGGKDVDIDIHVRTNRAEEALDRIKDKTDRVAEGTKNADSVQQQFQGHLAATGDTMEGWGAGLAFLKHMQEYIAGARDRMAELSEGTAELFDQLIDAWEGRQFGAWRRGIRAAQDETAELGQEIKRLRQEMMFTPGTLGKWFRQVGVAAAEAKRAYLEQTESAQAMIRTMEEWGETDAAVSADIVRDARAMADGYALLDRQTLDRLEAQIDRVTAANERMADSARSALERYQDLVDRQAGDELAIAERERARALRELEEQLAEARKANNLEAIRELEQAMELARRYHDEELRALRERLEAERAITGERERRSGAEAPPGGVHALPAGAEPPAEPRPAAPGQPPPRTLPASPLPPESRDRERAGSPPPLMTLRLESADAAAPAAELLGDEEQVRRLVETLERAGMTALRAY